MPILTGEVSLQGVEGSGFPEPVPAGVYRVRVIDVDLGQSEAGNEKWSLTTEIVAPQAFSGRRIPTFGCVLAITPKSLWKVKDAALSAGISSNVVRIDDFVGREMLVMIEEHAYEGNITNRVANFYHSKNTPKNVEKV